MIATADFETTTDINDCRVWAFGICEIGNYKNFKYGNTIEEFIWSYCADKKENHTFYFHNLKFDMEFILYWLFRNDFKYVENRKDFCNHSFTTLISDKGVVYSLEICFKKQGKKINKVTIFDSLKILNMSVENVAKSFNLPISKLDLDYKEKREKGHKLTEHEINYLRNDVEIMSRALEIMFNEGMDKMTIGSSALAEYKSLMGKQFNDLFPKVNDDAFIRKSYKGGWTYLNDKFKSETVDGGIVLDVNSLYPYIMRTRNLPYGYPIYYPGKYKKDKLYPIYVQSISCMFELKEGYLPTIQIKNDSRYCGTDYLHSSRDKNGVLNEVDLILTSVDLELFFEHYNVYNISYHCGYKFKCSNNLFSSYIDKWIDEKIKASIEGNDGLRTIAKLMLNTLYGKFALNPIVRSKIPYYVKDIDFVKYRYGEEEERDSLYIPIGTFITSYAREYTIKSAQKCYDRFIYSDTDSLHLKGYDLPSELNIDDNELGAWKNEFNFIKGKYLRQKCYMEEGFEPNKKKKFNKVFTKITCAGMPSRCHDGVTFDNFHIGTEYEGKLEVKRVSGGIVLLDNKFTIKEKTFLF